MRHYFDFVPNATTGAAISGAIVKLFDASDNLIDIFADESGTAIETVSGVANGAKTDSDGMFSLYVENGIYTVRFYVGDKILKTIRNVELSEDVTRTALEATTGASLIGTSTGDTVEEALVGKAPATFTQSGTGAVARTVADKLSETISVTDYMGVLSVTAAIQAALDTGKHVRIPAGAYTTTGPVSTTVAGQRISGDAGLTQIICTGTTAANAIQLLHDDCSVDGITVTPGDPDTGLANGWGIVVTGDRCSVTNNRIKGMRRGGIIIKDANGCVVASNIMSDSIVRGDGSELQSATGYDVYLMGSSSGNTVTTNQCISGCGVGIGLQTSTAAQAQVGNVVTGNVVKDHPGYGIMLYGFDATAPILEPIVTGNRVENISGSILIPANPPSYEQGERLFYGCGIYIASAQDFVCAANIVRDTNTDRSLPRSGSDTPAGIGISGYARGVVSGNLIRNAYHGIYYTQAGSLGAAISDGVTITGNNISDVDFVGIYAIDCINATITANRIVGSAHNQAGIHYRDTGTGLTKTCLLADNYIAGFNNGIETTGVIPQMIARTNILRDVATYGIYCRAAEAVIEGNSISAGDTGLVFTGAVVNGAALNNIISAPTEIDDGSTKVYRRGNHFSTGAISGSAPLIGGTATVNTSEVRNGDRVILSRGNLGGTPGHLSVGPINHGVSFPINSSDPADTSTVSWEILH